MPANSKKKYLEHIFMPNEVFSDLQCFIDNSKQIAFAYSYLYYVTYLYRYCKNVDGNGIKVTQDRIKQYLGYSANSAKIDYIIKRGGILDSIRYTETTTDYPITYDFDENTALYFTSVNSIKKDFHINDRNFRIKYPIRAFYRNEDDFADGLLTGTFYEVSNTHRIDFYIFESMMNNKDLGIVAFYIYGYLKFKCDIFRKGYQRSFRRLADDLKMSDKTVRKYVNNLASYGYIHVDRKVFIQNAEKDEMEANIYRIKKTT